MVKKNRGQHIQEETSTHKPKQNRKQGEKGIRTRKEEMRDKNKKRKQ